MSRKGDFFVMLTTQRGSYTPLMQEGDMDDIAKFETKDDACYAAVNNILGENFGFEVFEIGYGC